MIIVNLKGGIGNQLFQYALGRHLAIKNNDTLKLDVSGLDRANQVGDIYRPFALEAFAVPKSLATAEEVAQLKYPYGPISKAWRFVSFKLSRDKNTLFRPAVLKAKGDLYLDGYWQSPRYFEAIRETLLKDLVLTEPHSPATVAFENQIGSVNAVSLHVRRGDYTKNPRVKKEFGLCSLAYYEQAIAQIKETVTNPVFFIFSDDIDWVKNNLAPGETDVYVSDKTLCGVEELMLMSRCQHNIIANSSFSWWGAWLNKNPKKVVIAPTPWFDTIKYDTHLIPESWTTLPKK